MMKIALLASMFSMASAFYPSNPAKVNPGKSEALPWLPKPKNLEGYIGDVGFDPLRISDYVPMDYLREAELKHSRICMLAWSGYVAVDCGYRVFPVPEGWAELNSRTAHDVLVTDRLGGGPNGPLGQIFIWLAFAEMASWLGVSQMLQGSGREPGDFGFGKNFLPKDPKEAERRKLQELMNGRLAMVAFGAVVTQSVLFDTGFPYFSS